MAKKKTVVEVAVVGKKVDALAWVETNGFPKATQQFEDKKCLQKFYKQLDTPALEKWAGELGAEYNAYPENEAIHRMRVAMAILYVYYPKETKAKPESPYKKYTTEQLVDMALEHDVAIETTDDMRILRMRLIMGLRANKIIE